MSHSSSPFDALDEDAFSDLLSSSPSPPTTGAPTSTSTSHLGSPTHQPDLLLLPPLSLASFLAPPVSSEFLALPPPPLDALGNVIQPPAASASSSTTTTTTTTTATTVMSASSAAKRKGKRTESPVVAAAAKPVLGALEASGYRPKPSKRTRVGAAADDDAAVDAVIENRISTEEALDAAIAAREDATATMEAIAAFPDVAKDTSAALPREALLLATSDALDEWQKRLEAVRSLTSADQNELQRQRRLVKNRESAQLSRLRKKGYIGELEAQLTKLAAENDKLKTQNAALRSENERLKRTLSSTPTAIDVAAPPVPPVPVPPADSVAVDMDFDPAPVPSARGSRRQRGAAVSLLLMLISFGALWNAGQRTRAPALNAASTALVPVGSGRALMSVAEDSSPVAAPPVIAQPAPTATPAAAAAAAERVVVADAGDEQPFAWLSREAWRINASHDTAKAPLKAENGFVSLLDLVAARPKPDVRDVVQKRLEEQRRAPAPAQSYEEHKKQQHHQQRQKQEPQKTVQRIEAADAVAPWREASGPVPNATYWFTPQIRSLKRGEDATLLGIMLPLSAFDDTIEAGVDSPVIEVMCKVQSVHRTPFTQSSFNGDVTIE
jgi:hypothetical protein